MRRLRSSAKNLQQVFAPPEPGWRCAAAAGVSDSGGGGAATAAGGGGEAPTVVDINEDELGCMCPICLDNDDDATVDRNRAGTWFAYGGQSYCGACKAGGFADRSPNCPICRAPLIHRTLLVVCTIMVGVCSKIMLKHSSGTESQVRKVRKVSRGRVCGGAMPPR